ncbi:MAG: 16S rRNA (uracil(1498)-N(3))-methyltransferase [Alphaproteobacteria bacterium]
MAEKLKNLPEFARVRLFTGEDLRAGAAIELGPQPSHYLLHVMRRAAGDAIRLFNGRDGEWSATLEVAKRAARANVGERTRMQDKVPDVALLFAPIKKAPMGWLVEKATELGVARLQPVITARTQGGQVSPERLRAHAIEAAEQSWRLSVPEIGAPVSLLAALDALPPEARVLYCDERREAAPALRALAAARAPTGKAWAILIGPEGGFTPEEQEMLCLRSNLVAVSLGPRIVRAETAAIMALTLWQSVLGDLAG